MTTIMRLMPNWTCTRVRAPLVFLLLAALVMPAGAQQQSAPTSSSDTAPTPPAPISDNSFLVEEAYNQGAGIVQHIGTFRRDRAGGWLATFTQEWPAPSQRDQLSYTVPLQSNESSSGLGDVAINYRRQLLGKDEEPIWFSPRLSVILPTGSVRNGRGAGGPGVQVNFPLSITVDPGLVTHWNIGGTMTRARSESGTHGTTRAVNAAASAIWLATPIFNVMLESAWDRTEMLTAEGVRESTDSFVILPGVRAAINLPSGMQIVPGIGVPIGVGPSRGERDLFLYLSVEHAFR
ncbi:MAG: transporter [Gemmatimonadaceae bacterium]